MAPRHGRTTVDQWTAPVLRTDQLNKGFGKRSKVTMFPSTHDIHPDQIDETVAFLGKLLQLGNDVLIVSKAHEECMHRIVTDLAEYKEHITIRCTIGSADDAVLRFWEPEAPGFDERIRCLRMAQESGFTTSVSCEPMLDNDIEAVVEAAAPHVTETIWIGKPKDLIKRIKINGHGDDNTVQRAQQLIDWHSDERIMQLYKAYKNDPMIWWKDSIIEVVQRNQNQSLATGA
jgi:DNA repair photolyase